jgi:hypothetical protein
MSQRRSRHPRSGWAATRRSLWYSGVTGAITGLRGYSEFIGSCFTALKVPSRSGQLDARWYSRRDWLHHGAAEATLFIIWRSPAHRSQEHSQSQTIRRSLVFYRHDWRHHGGCRGYSEFIGSPTQPLSRAPSTSELDTCRHTGCDGHNRSLGALTEALQSDVRGHLGHNATALRAPSTSQAARRAGWV